MEWRCMRGKIIKRLMTFAFEKTSNITSSYKPIPVQYREYENGLFYLFFRLILAKLVNWEHNEWLVGARVQRPENFCHPT